MQKMATQDALICILDNIGCKKEYIIQMEEMFTQSHPFPLDKSLILRRFFETNQYVFLPRNKTQKNPPHILVTTLSYGCLEVSKAIYNRVEQIDLHIEKRNMEIILTALAKLSHVEAIKWVYNTKLSDQSKNMIMKYAILSKDLALVQYLDDLGTIYPKDPIYLAMEVGALDILQWLHNKGFRPIQAILLEDVIVHGSLEFVRWVYETLEPDTSYSLDKAGAYGHMHIVEYLLNNGIKHGSNIREYIVKNNQLALLKHIPTSSSPPNQDLVEYGAKYGRLDIIKAFYVSGSKDSVITSYATKSGYMHILKWQNTQHTLVPKQSDLANACAKGYLDVVKFFTQLGFRCFKKWELVSAAKNKYYDVLKYLYFEGVFIYKSAWRHLLKNAIFDDRLDIVHWMCEQTLLSQTTSSLVKIPTSIFNRSGELAIQSGHLSINRFIFEHFPDRYAPDTILSAIRHRHLDICKWVIRNINTRLGSDALISTIYTKEHDIFTFIYEKIKYKERDTELLQHALTCGQTKTIEYLLNVGHVAYDEIYISNGKNHPFENFDKFRKFEELISRVKGLKEKKMDEKSLSFPKKRLKVNE